MVDRVGGGDSFMGDVLACAYDDGSARSISRSRRRAQALDLRDFNLVTVAEVEKLMGGDAYGRRFALPPRRLAWQSGPSGPHSFWGPGHAHQKRTPASGDPAGVLHTTVASGSVFLIRAPAGPAGRSTERRTPARYRPPVTIVAVTWRAVLGWRRRTVDHTLGSSPSPIRPRPAAGSRRYTGITC